MLNLYLISLSCFLLLICSLITFELYKAAVQYITIYRLSENENRSFQQNIDLIQIYIKRKEWMNSIKILELHLSNSANNFIDYYTYIGLCYFYLKKYNLAEYYYNKTIKQNSKNIFALNCLANLYEGTKQIDKAISILKEILSIDDKNSKITIKRLAKIHKMKSG